MCKYLGMFMSEAQNLFDITEITELLSDNFNAVLSIWKTNLLFNFMQFDIPLKYFHQLEWMFIGQLIS